MKKCSEMERGYKSMENFSMNIIENRYRYTFLASLIVGILTHGMTMFNKYAMHDEAAYYLFDKGMSDWWLTGGTYKAGRWMLGIIGQVTGIVTGDNISTTSFAVLISITCLSLSACVVVKTLDIKNDVCAVLLGTLMVTYPVVVGLFGFMFVAPQYLFGLLLGFVGTYFICIKRTKVYWGVGIILAGASIGVYQAYIPCILSVFLFRFIKDNCFEERELHDEIKDIEYYIVSVVGFMGVYIVANKLCLSILDFELIDYKGINSMFDISRIIPRIINIFKYFFEYDARVWDVSYPRTVRYIYYVCILIWVVSTVLVSYSRKYNNNGI